MKRTLVVAALIGCLLATTSAAQSPVSIEVTGTGIMPTQSLSGADLDNGFGFGVNVRYRFLPHLAAYGGWDWHHTRSADLYPSATTDVEDTGYAFGLRFEHPLTGELAYWVRAGGLYNHIELENADGDRLADTGHGLGWEIGGGVAVPVGARVSLTPGVRYRTLTRDLEVGSTTASRTLSYMAVGVGVAYTF